MESKKTSNHDPFYQPFDYSKLQLLSNIALPFVNDGSITAKSYQPDICIFDGNTGLFYDIEVDEPYSLKEGKPIHYLNEQGISRDYNRDEFFVNSALWGVIRLAEEQVIKYPNECIEYVFSNIESVYASFPFAINRFNSEYINSVKSENYVSPTLIEKWGYTDALDLVKKGKRENYLGINKVFRSESLDDDLPF